MDFSEGYGAGPFNAAGPAPLLNIPVIPAKAGTSGREGTAGLPEVPAFAGMTERIDLEAFSWDLGRDDDPRDPHRLLLRLLRAGRCARLALVVGHILRRGARPSMVNRTL
jgi:hypothetical protein